MIDGVLGTMTSVTDWWSSGEAIASIDRFRVWPISGKPLGMDWGSVPDWVSALAAIAVAVAAGVAAWQGLKGLNTWRAETIGRRRLELAEHVLADFYEARDTLAWVRSPVGYANESDERPGRDVEPEAVQTNRDSYYRPIKRLSDHSELFSRLQARRYRVIATFGTDAAEPFDELRSIHSSIVAAARTLMMTSGHTEMSERQKKKFDEREETIWSGLADIDLIDAKLTKIIADVEQRFRKEIG